MHRVHIFLALYYGTISNIICTLNFEKISYMLTGISSNRWFEVLILGIWELKEVLTRLHPFLKQEYTIIRKRCSRIKRATIT